MSDYHPQEAGAAAGGLPRGYVDPAAPQGEWLHAERPVRFRPLAFLGRVFEIWLILFASFALYAVAGPGSWAYAFAGSLGVAGIIFLVAIVWGLLRARRRWVLLDAETLRTSPSPRDVVDLGEVVAMERIDGWWPLLKARYRAIGRDRTLTPPGPTVAFALTQQGASWHNTHFLVATDHPDAFQRALEAAVPRARQPQAGPAVLSDEAPPWLRDQARRGDASSSEPGPPDGAGRDGSGPISGG